ncbi:hypothetical protein MNAN1_002108 [Malassezia nana]|uniref:Nudix hydrolase domain-containing protein n=1 Tax=Malassezia nana TaxID=180528 RepID=A0AAF0J2K7_9BASI|nr:hypothetical protein MNAN1_002108 [Malassezia nana]
MGASTGSRHVAIAIAVRVDETKTGCDRVLVCLVSSRKHKKHLVLPKGGVEAGEMARAAAQRELNEEGTYTALTKAGVDASMEMPPWWPAETEPAIIKDPRPHASSPTKCSTDPAFVAHTLYSVHEFLVTESACKETWLESDERSRHWVPWNEAYESVKWRNGLGEAMQRAAICTSAYLPRTGDEN